jgi:hypothetical protein
MSSAIHDFPTFGRPARIVTPSGNSSGTTKDVGGKTLFSSEAAVNAPAIFRDRRRPRFRLGGKQVDILGQIAKVEPIGNIFAVIRRH